MNLNLSEYRDKVMGCWLGKNIGGTFGAPYEGEPEPNDAEFYINIIPGEPLPNDDLDIQLVWLLAAEERGVRHLTPRILGEYWMKYVTGPWNEYGICRVNIGNGLTPPLSGSMNNENWKASNGAWIRSEIWACIAPGAPDEAVRLAYMDACCDHYGEGIFAEMYTAALESAAFAVTDIRELIKIGLSKIPADSRVARSVNLVCQCYDQGMSYREAREAVVKDSTDLGWFQAPGNLGFVTIGLLYGEGDFDKSLRYAVNCGDDSDCTGATVGSIMGIQYGAAKIPRRWIEPIGLGLRTIAVNNVDLLVPKNLQELADRVERVAIEAALDEPRHLLPITEEPAVLPSSRELAGSELVRTKIWNLSPYALTFDLPWGELVVDYEGGAGVTPGEVKKLTVYFQKIAMLSGGVELEFTLPEGWAMRPGNAFSMVIQSRLRSSISVELIPGALAGGSYRYLPLTVRLQERNAPQVVMVPFQLNGAVNYERTEYSRSFHGEPADYTEWIDHRRWLLSKRKTKG